MTAAFEAALRAAEREHPTTGPAERPRQWFYVPYDQLSHRYGPWTRVEPERVGLVFVESVWKAERRPVHRQKLALILANQRHFAVEMARRGARIDYRTTRERYAPALAAVVAERGPLAMMRPAERELRADLAQLVRQGALELRSHEGWLTSPAQFRRACPEPPWRMVDFYRHVRRDTGMLMDGAPPGRPRGGKLSFDADNREPWRGDPPAPALPRFEPDAITREVGELIEARFAHHPGRLDLGALPATQADAERTLAWALDRCLEHFGPYEDAMSATQRNLFHTRLSPLLNIGRLGPRQVLDAALAREDRVPLNSLEGFVRQLLGWREFVHHVHEATDGFRRLPNGKAPVDPAPDDGGWSTWAGRDWSSPSAPTVDGGARPNLLGAREGVPPAYWGAPSGLRCLDGVVADVWDEGMTHHIPRLMVLANIAQLLDLEPRALTNWFWSAYVDAFDWVVEPNVLAMGSFAVGELMTTKPYVSGSGYIQRMSDYCSSCAFHPKKSCPLTPMYWAYLARHDALLFEVGRSQRQVWSVRKRDPAKRRRDAATFEFVQATLRAGERLSPEGLAAALADAD